MQSSVNFNSNNQALLRRVMLNEDIMGKMKTQLRYQLPLLLSALLVLSGCGDKKSAGAAAMQMPPPGVEVVTLKTETVELTDLLPARVSAFRSAERSEERRVGKECRSRWWPDH